ncbi:MAG: hypothetical protein LBL28_00140 [Treponema sp.]|jgi:hypothetical protein|nr:hypothetical protein [Treponema sp.]
MASGAISAVHAIPARQNRNAPEAIALLLGLLEDGFREPVILLFLADLYEYELKDCQKSKEYLERYLRFKDDEAALERLLRGEQTDREL